MGILPMVHVLVHFGGTPNQQSHERDEVEVVSLARLLVAAAPQRRVSTRVTWAGSPCYGVRRRACTTRPSHSVATQTAVAIAAGGSGIAVAPPAGSSVPVIVCS